VDVNVTLRPAAATVRACFLRNQRAEQRRGDRDPSPAIHAFVQTALEAGVPIRDVASGVMLGVLRTAGNGGWTAGIRAASAATFTAALRHGGLIQPTIEGILAGTHGAATDAGEDAEDAMVAATSGVISALDNPELF
jgi:hypothetical protein